MTGDDRLRAELEALERSAPGAAPPIGDTGRPRRWLGVGLLAGTVVTAAALTAMAVGPLRSLPLGHVSPSPNPPVSAETRVGDFILTVQSPRSIWTTDEAIDLSATLRYVGEQREVKLGGGGIGISLIQLTGGDGELIAAFAGACYLDLYRIEPNVPVHVPYEKSGQVHEDGLFDEAFFQDPELRLPPGRWLVHAGASLGVDDCNGLNLETSVEIEVVAADGSPAPSTELPPPESSESAPPGREVEVAGMRVTVPPGWTYHLPTFVSWGPAKPVIYFSNQPMHDECTRTANSETCARPIDELVPDGVLIEWWVSGDYPYPAPRPLPWGAPFEISGVEAVRANVSPDACVAHATDAERIVFRRSDMALDQLTVCSRQVTRATRTALDDLLASIEFMGTASD